MEILLTVLFIILIVALSGVIKQILPIKIPLPIIQIVLGAIIAAAKGAFIQWTDLTLHIKLSPNLFTLDPELFLVLFIPPLLFEDARKMPLPDFIRSSREILSLALTLVFITIIGLGYFIHLFFPAMPFPVAVALAAVLSPTDAVALSSIVGKGRLPGKMMRILEGEALMNDASALVSLKFAIAVAMGFLAFKTLGDVGNFSLQFVKMSIGGLITGFVITWIYITLVQFFSRFHDDDPTIQIIFLILLPPVIYVIAEHFGFSGILAAVAGGMTASYSGFMRRAPINMRFRANNAWSLLEYILNGTIFLLLGLQIPEVISITSNNVAMDDTVTFTALIIAIFAIYIGLMVVRFAWLAIMKESSRHLFKRKPLQFADFSYRQLLILTFSGVRGAVTLAAALTLPLTIGTRYQVIFLATGVIILSLIAGILLLPWLLRDTILDNTPQLEEEKLAKEAITTAAVNGVFTLQERLTADNPDLDHQILAQVIGRVISDVQRYNGLADHSEMTENLELRIRLTALRSQRGELFNLRKQHLIGDEVCDKLQHEIDLAETLLIGRSKTRQHH